MAGYISYTDYDRRDRRQRRKAGPLRVFLRSLGVILLVLLLAALAIGIFGFSRFRELERSARAINADARTVIDTVKLIPEDMMDSSTVTLEEHVQLISDANDRMNLELTREVWELAERVPFVRHDIYNARKLVEILDDVTQTALKPLVETRKGMTLSNLVTDSEINIEALTNIISLLSDMEPTLTRTQENINGMTPGIIPQINSAMNRAKDMIDPIYNLVVGANKIAPIIPQIFGSDGVRHYVVAAQTISESRFGGGGIGSIGLLTVDNGHFEIGHFATPFNFDPSYVELTPTQVAFAYSNSDILWPDYYTFNATTFPDFAESGKCIADHWEVGHNYDVNIDGTIAVDPVFFQTMLELTGTSLTVSGELVNGTNAARLLLNDVYFRFPTEEQDPFFAEVASQSFDAILSSISNVSMKDLIDMVSENAAERHLMIWFKDDAEQSLARDAGIAETFPVDVNLPQVGLYYYVCNGSKMTWYTSRDLTLGEGTQNADGSYTYRATGTLTNHVTWAEVPNIPRYVTGRFHFGPIPLIVIIYPPLGGSITNVESTHSFYPVQIGEYEIWMADVLLEPQETLTVNYDVTCAPGVDTVPTIDMTPSAQDVAGW